jgi:hypothetical protein
MEGWGDNIKMHIKEIMCEDMDSINMAQDVDKLRHVDNQSLIDSGLDKIRGTA